VLILLHNDPDPDAIAAGLALRQLLSEAAGVPSEMVYKGMIGRAENKALVEYLGRPLRVLRDEDWLDSPAIALMDTQPGAGNNAMPAGTHVALVIDHHPRLAERFDADFVDIRPWVGALSTMLTQYLQAAKIEFSQQLATALFYGIKTDTAGLSRGTSPEDRSAYLFLQPHTDTRALGQIERAEVSAGYFRQLTAALANARIYDGVVISYIGEMDWPDMAAEMADLLMRLEGARWVICMGVYDKEMVLSARTYERDGAGDLVQAMVKDAGMAGGHGALAGGHVPLDDRAPQRVFQMLTQRALVALNVPPEAEGRKLI